MLTIGFILVTNSLRFSDRVPKDLVFSLPKCFVWPLTLSKPALLVGTNVH